MTVGGGWTVGGTLDQKLTTTVCHVSHSGAGWLTHNTDPDGGLDVLVATVVGQQLHQDVSPQTVAGLGQVVRQTAQHHLSLGLQNISCDDDDGGDDDEKGDDNDEDNSNKNNNDGHDQNNHKDDEMMALKSTNLHLLQQSIHRAVKCLQHISTQGRWAISVSLTTHLCSLCQKSVQPQSLTELNSHLCLVYVESEAINQWW